MTSLFLYNAYFITDEGVNLICQGKIQKERCLLKIVTFRRKIGHDQGIAKLIGNNLCILHTSNFQLLFSFFAKINSKI